MEDRFILAELESGFPDKNRKGPYLQLFGLAVGSLLAQVAYWHLPKKDGTSRLRVSKLGKFWVAKTRQQWMMECNLTLDQYCRATAVLQEMGLIEVRQMKFNNLNVSHTRLVLPALVARMKKLAENGITSSQWVTATHPHRVRKTPLSDGNPIAPLVGIPSLKSGESHHSKSDGKATTLLTDSTSENPKEITICYAPPVVAETGMIRDGVGKNNKGKLTKGLKQDFLGAETDEAKIEQLQTTHQGYGVLKKPNLASLWQSLTAELVEFQKPMTQKQRGQLKSLEKSVGVERAPELIAFVIEHWHTFCLEATSDSGTKTWPVFPHVGYLLAHHDTAMNLFLQSIAKSAVKVFEETQSLPQAPAEEMQEEPEVAQAATEEEDQPLPENWWRDTLERFRPRGDDL